MTVFFHELKRCKVSLGIWTAVITFMLAVCVVIYPEMSSQMGEISTVFADMGSFSRAFGMDQLNFGEFSGYFGIECGNVLGMGGAFFAAILGISALAKEEKEHTAEFLLTHPITRCRIITEKLCAIVAQIVLLNVVVIGMTCLSVVAIGESVDVKTFALLFLAYFLLQLELALVTFGISSFIRGNGIGAGLGIAVSMYFLNIIANLTEDLEFLKWITPFGYTDSADIITDKALNLGYVAVGMAFAFLGILAAYVKYTKKNIT